VDEAESSDREEVLGLSPAEWLADPTDVERGPEAPGCGQHRLLVHLNAPPNLVVRM
jgi:hypothetical protein